MIKFFFEFKKPCFWSISPIFRVKNVFPKKSGSVMHIRVYKGNDFWAPFQNSEKSDDSVPIKQLEGQQDRRKDRPCFIGPFCLLQRVQRVHLLKTEHLKVRDIQCDVGLTKNFCITVSMQKTSSIHKLIFKIEPILGSKELNRHTHFWPHPPKNHWNSF